MGLLHINGLSHDDLELLNQQGEAFVRFTRRFFAVALVLGVAFTLFADFAANVSRTPERYLFIQGFAFNYSEAINKPVQRVTLAGPHAIATAQTQALQNSQTLAITGPEVSDPNWDGALTGATIGLNAGQQIPIIGPVLGPLIGAWYGYRLDARI